MMIDSEALQKARLAKGLSQPALAKLVGCSQQLIGALERGTTKTTKFLPRIAKILAIAPSVLDPDWDNLPVPSPLPSSDGNVNQAERINPIVHSPTLPIIPNAELMGDVDLPVYSIVQGGSKGALVLENEPFTYTTRPRRLVGKKDGYGVLVRGNSMAREYNEGDTAWIDPRLHPKKGDPCIFQGTREDGTVEAMIKYLERSPDASETVYYVSQTNPPKKFTIKKADWQKCHVAVGKESGR